MKVARHWTWLLGESQFEKTTCVTWNWTIWLSEGTWLRCEPVCCYMLLKQQFCRLHENDWCVTNKLVQHYWNSGFADYMNMTAMWLTIWYKMLLKQGFCRLHEHDCYVTNKLMQHTIETAVLQTTWTWLQCGQQSGATCYWNSGQWKSEALASS